MFSKLIMNFLLDALLSPFHFSLHFFLSVLFSSSFILSSFCLLALIYSFAMKKDGWQGRNEGRILGKGSFQSVIPAFSLVLLI